MECDIYDEDYEVFWDLVKDFVKCYVNNEVIEKWNVDGEVDCVMMFVVGEVGIIGLLVFEEFGGVGML